MKNEMRTSLKEKIHELEGWNERLSERNRDIEHALNRLHQVQEDLVRSERLALTAKMTAQLLDVYRGSVIPLEKPHHPITYAQFSPGHLYPTFHKSTRWRREWHHLTRSIFLVD